MTATFGHKWTSVHGDNFAETSGRIWAIELAGFGQRAIQRGLDMAMTQVWPPSLQEFKAWCRGVLTLAQVDLQLQGQPKDQQPFTILVRRFISDDEWRMASPERRERILQRAHDLATAHIATGGAMPAYTPAAQQLTKEDQQEPLPPIMLTAHDAIDTIKRTLGIQNREAEPPPEPPAPKAAKDCVRCHGTRKEPGSQGECLACYGSGCEAAYNRVVHQDGKIEDRMP